MAKGDAGKVQSQINKQGQLGQGRIDQIWGDYNTLAYGNQPTSGYSAPKPQPIGTAPRFFSKELSARYPQGTPIYSGGTTTPPQSSGNASNFNLQTVQQLLAPHGGVVTPESLAAIEPQLKQMGITLQKNSAGEIRGRAYLPDGTAIDLVDQWGLPPVFKGGGENMYGPGGQQGGGGYLGGLANAIAGYGDFAQTGGLSPQNIADIRARALSPIRANYALAQDELQRGKNLAGGYMPNFAPALAKMAREQSYAMSDANVNTSAMLAEAIRSGRLAGLGGLSELGLGLGGQRLNAAQLQNQLGSMLIQAQLGKSQVPSNFSQALGNIGQVAGIAGSVINPFF